MAQQHNLNSDEEHFKSDHHQLDSQETAGASAQEDMATCLICLGMAGSGKTTFVQRVNAYLHSRQTPPYIVNLDPAVHEVPFPANIDIRDTVKYKEVMKQYGLGPNGGIVTSLNLFATRFDQAIKFIEKKQHDYKYVLFDTPGQIEVFTWSASGSIITDSLASTCPTVIVYVMDTSRCVSPITFMSNMLYACSILYKSRLPFVLVMNKIDIVSHDFAIEWMTDFESFQQAVDEEGSYMANLTSSMNLVLDEFYNNLKTVGVSAVTGEGLDEFFTAVDSAREEYLTQYKPEYDRLVEKKNQLKSEEQQEQLRKLKDDLKDADVVPMKAKPVTTDDVCEPTMRKRPHVTFADPDDAEDNTMSTDEDNERPLEEESFKRFLRHSED
ncbi:GPN-loop GTPase 1 [Trichoplax sp. H2]|nr:GPN-loop GTPase 1 [Trichoplax sp. H2]|eukprot:RDD41779.1 GPN-loop GTPase 1 [Trichoplax sp. H2]